MSFENQRDEPKPARRHSPRISKRFLEQQNLSEQQNVSVQKLSLDRHFAAVVMPASSSKKSSESATAQVQKEVALLDLRGRMDGFVDKAVIDRDVDIANDYPMLLGADAQNIQTTLRSLYSGWNTKDLINISFAMAKYKQQTRDITLTALNGILATRGARACQRREEAFLSYQDKGVAMKKARLKNLEFPQPMQEDKAEIMWPKAIWDEVILEEEAISKASGKKFRKEVVMQRLLEHADFGQFQFELVLSGNQPTKAVGTFKPDLILALKGFPITPYTVGAVIGLRSKGGGSLYDNQEDVGRLCMYGEMLLKRAGPVRKTILLGISDLKTVRFFRLTSQQDCSNNDYPYFTDARSDATASVRLSFCALVASELSVLGMDTSLTVLCLFQERGWNANRFLGSGATSYVYEVQKGSQICAIKFPNSGSCQLHNDVKYLKALHDVDGVPRFVESIGSMFILEPMGKCISKIDDIKQASVSLADLVDVLSASHSEKLVNRDVRIENIMISRSLLDKSMNRLFLLDWGFATMCDIAADFQGSVVTTSDEVLKQKVDGMVVYRCVDDLISLVRCTHLLCHPEVVAHVYGLGIEGCRLFWKKRLEQLVWKIAEAAASAGDYETLKSLLTEIQSIYPLV